MTDSDRCTWLRRGRLLTLLTIGYNLIEGVLAVAAGTRADSVALTGFGVDSFVEVTSAAVVGLRLHLELRRGPAADDENIERIERRAGLVAGGLLLLLGASLLVEAIRRLSGLGAAPGSSTLGIALTGISLLLMPLLARAKFRAASALESPALRADAMETLACSWLSLTTLLGLVLNAALGWWWADPVAALILVPLIVKEGLEAVRGDCGACAQDGS